MTAVPPLQAADRQSSQNPHILFFGNKYAPLLLAVHLLQRASDTTGEQALICMFCYLQLRRAAWGQMFRFGLAGLLISDKPCWLNVVLNPYLTQVLCRMATGMMSAEKLSCAHC